MDGCGSTLPTSVRSLVQHVRSLVERDLEDGNWQSVFNELRSVAPTIWGRWTLTERRRFLRHVRPFWEVHRHRIAPVVHSRIARAQARGQLTVLRGRIQNVERKAGQNLARISMTHANRMRTLDVAHVINCTGPESDLLRSSNPLLQNLISDSLARADALGLGLSVDGHSRVIAGNGGVHRSLFALGSLTKGSRWEAIAVAEIRDQAAAVARKLTRDFAYAVDHAAGLAPVGSFRQSVA
jgi:uncharacterized NAD(P)/FAD-binding protein YdhS